MEELFLLGLTITVKKSISIREYKGGLVGILYMCYDLFYEAVVIRLSNDATMLYDGL